MINQAFVLAAVKLGYDFQCYGKAELKRKADELASPALWNWLLRILGA